MFYVQAINKLHILQKKNIDMVIIKIPIQLMLYNCLCNYIHHACALNYLFTMSIQTKKNKSKIMGCNWDLYSFLITTDRFLSNT